MSAVQFGSLFKFIRNGMNVKQDKSGEGLPVTRIETISDATIDGTRVGFAGLVEADCRDWLLKRGDILFSHINSVEHVGKSAVYRGTPENLVHGMNLLCLRCDTSKILPEYAKYLIRGNDFRARLSSFINKAVNQASVSIGNLKTIPVTIPSLPEQQRIAEILDKADELRAKRRAALAQLDTLTQSIFLDMFGNPATNPKGWPQVPIGDHASKIGSGATPLGGEEAYKAAGISLIRSMNVRDGTFLRDGLAFIDDEQAARLEGVVVEADDVLLNITGASVARVCRAPATVLPARVNQHVAIIRPTSSFSPCFLEQCLLSPAVKKRLLRIARAGATREAITKSAIEQFRVIRPPREIQDRFAARVDATEMTHLHMCSAIVEMDSLFASLQHRAFRGEL